MSEGNLTDKWFQYPEFMLALAVWREARGEPVLGKMAVAQTIENRVQDERWPDTYDQVVTQEWQFSAFNKNDPNSTKFPKGDDPVWEACLEAARIVKDSYLDFACGANHYHHKDIKPDWAEGETPCFEAGNHVFYRL